MTPKIVVGVSVLLQICCHFDWGMQYLCIFVEEAVTLLSANTDECVRTLFCGRSRNNDQVKVAAKNIYARMFACELWVKRVGTFGAVLYLNRRPKEP